MCRDLIRFPPNLKKGKLCDKSLANRECETLTLLSDCRIFDKSTRQTQIVSYGNPVVRQILQRYTIGSKKLVEELDIALKVRQSVPDIAVSQRNRPTVQYAPPAREVYQFWHCRCPRLQTTMIFLSPSPPLCEPKEVRSSSLCASSV